MYMFAAPSVRTTSLIQYQCCAAESIRGRRASRHVYALDQTQARSSRRLRNAHEARIGGKINGGSNRQGYSSLESNGVGKRGPALEGGVWEAVRRVNETLSADVRIARELIAVPGPFRWTGKGHVWVGGLR